MLKCRRRSQQIEKLWLLIFVRILGVYPCSVRVSFHPIGNFVRYDFTLTLILYFEIMADIGIALGLLENTGDAEADEERYVNWWIQAWTCGSCSAVIQVP